MIRRSLGAALWTLVGLLAGFLGALSSLVGTGAGRALLARVSEGALHQVFTGTMEIGDVHGSLLTGLTLSQVRLFDADTTLVAWLPEVNVSYNPFDFAAGRVVLFEFDLRQPVINIVQHPNGRLNIEELLRLGGPDKGPHGPAALILFRNVRITDGTVTLRLQAKRPEPGDSSLEFASDDPNGRLRVRRFEHLDARLSALQVSSPRERGIRIDISRLAMESSDPAVRVEDAVGRLRVIGDSMDVQLARVRLPHSALRDARGTLRWPHGPLLFDLRLRADSATLDDFPFIDRRFARVPGAVVSGDVRLRSHGERVLEVGLDPLRLAYHGGTVAGRLTALSVADSGLVALRDADLDAREFDLEFARPFLDTLPFAGRLTGHTLATGPLAALALETDWSFRDSLGSGWPQTRIRGKGEVNLKAADGMHFQPFAVEASSIDLGTVAQLAPAVRLHGTLSAAATLTGPLRGAQFAGRLEHRDGARPPSVLTGNVRLDTRSEALRIYADVTADSLSFDGLRGSFPTLPLQGAVTGPVKLAGPLGALETHVDLHSRGGDLRGDGTLMLDLPHYGAQYRQVTARAVDLAHWLGRVAPPSRLSFTVRADFAGDSAVPPLGTVQAILEPSRLAGAGVDSGAVRVRFADRRLYVDSLRVAQPGLIATGSGSLGWARGTRGQLALDFDADSLNVLDPLVGWLAGAGGAPDALNDPGGEVAENAPLAGSARLLPRLQGPLGSIGLDARASAERLAWRAWRVPAGRGHFAWQPGPAPTFALEATLDSVAHGMFGFSGAFAAARGTPDSLTWLARSRIGEGGAFLAGGRFARRADRTGNAALAVGVDSLAVHLPGDVWVLERPTELTVTDSAATVTGLVLQGAYGSGKLMLEGALPTRGRAAAHLQLEGFPLVGLYALLQRDTAGVGGTVTATAGLSGTRASPVSSGSFSLSNGAFGEFRAPFVDGTYDYHDRRLRGAAHLWRSGQQILDVQAYLPLDLALEPVPRRQLPDTLSVGARADSVDLSVLEALTPSLQRVTGVFSADLGIAGTWDAPRLRGELQIATAAATIPTLNVRYEDVTGRLTFSGDTIAIQSLSARSERGRADFTGIVRLEQLTHPVLDLQIAADQFKALDLKNNVAITASGRLSLTGPVFGATLTGHAKVTSGVLYFADLVQKRIVNLDELADTSLAALIQQQRLGPEFENVFLDSLRIEDLELEMGSDVWLRSDEANIQLAGSARLTKQRNQYLVSGTLQAVRGTYRLKVGPVTREFIVKQGTVRYYGTPDQDAALDIRGTHAVHPVPSRGQPAPPDVTVVAHIGGTLLIPKVTLEGDKIDLPQAELISYLLFGKSSVELGGEQGSIADQRALVQSALAVLSGEIEQTIVSGGIPVDYVEIRPGTGDEGGPLIGNLQLAVGRQIGPKTFLVVNAGFCEGRTIARGSLGLSLQFRISAEWRTEASFQPVQTCSDAAASETYGSTVPRQVGFDLFWEKRY